MQATLASLRDHAAQHIARLREVLRDPEGVASLGAENALAELPELREIAETRLACMTWRRGSAPLRSLGSPRPATSWKGQTPRSPITSMI